MVTANPGKSPNSLKSGQNKPSKNVLHIGGVQVEFPYQPYGSQLAFMGRVISTLNRALREGHCHALLESPTGTGKSLSLLCSALAWQQNYKEKSQQGTLSQSKASPEAMTDPLNYGGGFVPEMEPSGNTAPVKSQPTQSTEDGKAKRKSPPTIIYSSRTHSQLSQVIREYRKTAYRVPMAVLASRKHYCTNPQVRGKENIDEECKMLLRNPDVGCSEFRNVNKVKAHPSLQRGGCHEAHDIEDLVRVGQVVRGCSYYAAVSMEDDAQLVFCPYSYIINPVIRGAMDVDINGAIIILDEAHNIEDIARDAGSVDIEEDVLQKLLTELEELCMVDAIIYQPLCEMAQDLISWIDRKKSTLERREFQHYVSCWSGDKALRELQEAQITQQCFPILLECATKAIKAATDMESEVPHLSGQSVLTLEGLFSSLTYFFSRNGVHIFDYQLSLQRYIKRNTEHGIGYPVYCFSLWCLNPAVVFNDVAALSLSVVLTSGTLSPMNSFSTELGVQFGTCLEAPHVIDVKSQVCAAIVSTGPDQYPLNASYKTADKYVFQDVLGKTLEEIFKIVPGGCLVFFPSYKLMEKLCIRWRETGQWLRLSARKSLFVEPRGGSQEDFEPVLKGYYDSIRRGNKALVPKKRRIKRLDSTQSNKMESSGDLQKGGAAFLAVCRGKVSEGIDFSDENARAVIIVGIPFPNVNDIQVGLKKKYNDTYKSTKNLLSGSEWYCQQAFRALNQAAGRCIRHALDYGAIILLDERYCEERNRANISKWLKNSIKLYDSFDASLESLKSFFSDVKGRVGEKVGNMGNDSCTSWEAGAPTSIKQSKIQTRKKNQRVNDSAHVDQKTISYSTHEAAFPQQKSQGNLDSQKPHQNSVTNFGRHKEYIDLECDFEEISRCSAGYPNGFQEDPELSVVKETPPLNGNFTSYHLRSLSKDDNSASSIIQSSVELPDQLSPHSVSLSGPSIGHSVAECSALLTPERDTTAITYDLKPEIESLSSSVNSHAQRRRKFMSSPLAGSIMDKNPNVAGINNSSFLGLMQNLSSSRDSYRRIEFDSENRFSEAISQKLSVPTVSEIANGTTESVSLYHGVEKRLIISCSLCKAHLGLPENSLYVTCSSVPSTKVHLKKLVEGSLTACSVTESAGIQVLICDVSSVAPQLCKTSSDGGQGQGTWCKEDGCVFKNIICPFCDSPKNCLGVQTMATDASNIHLLNKILLFAHHLEIKEVGALGDDNSKDMGMTVECSREAENDSLKSIEKFAYTPKQQSTGGWRTTKSKLRLPRRPLLSNWEE